MATENVSTKTTTSPSVSNKATEDEIDKETYQQMLNILDELTDHTHIFYDDYGTACNCNCNCNCTRGTC